jgi:hypothetical protein
MSATMQTNYLIKALYNAKIEELTQSYRAKGFAPDDKLAKEGDFDLVLRNEKTGKAVAFAINRTMPDESGVSSVLKLAEKARAANYDFRMVTFHPPTKGEIKIDWFDKALFQYLLDNPPDDLSPGPPVRCEGVETEVDSIKMVGKKAFVKVFGTIGVSVYFCGEEFPDSFPFEGDFELDLENESVVDAKFFHVDTTEWSKDGDWNEDERQS